MRKKLIIMSRNIFLVLSVVFASFYASAQENPFEFKSESENNSITDSILADTVTIIGVVYEEDSRAQSLLYSLAKFNVQGDFIIKEGYQIQISFNADRAKAEEQRLKLIKMYPGVESKIEYDAPYYTVKVGSFENIDDAEDFRTLITGSFPTCIIQRTRIKIPISRN